MSDIHGCSLPNKVFSSCLHQRPFEFLVIFMELADSGTLTFSSVPGSACRPPLAVLPPVSEQSDGQEEGLNSLEDNSTRTHTSPQCCNTSTCATQVHCLQGLSPGHLAMVASQASRDNVERLQTFTQQIGIPENCLLLWSTCEMSPLGSCV